MPYRIPCPTWQLTGSPSYCKITKPASRTSDHFYNSVTFRLVNVVLSGTLYSTQCALTGISNVLRAAEILSVVFARPVINTRPVPAMQIQIAASDNFKSWSEHNACTTRLEFHWWVANTGLWKVSTELFRLQRLQVCPSFIPNIIIYISAI